MPAAGEAQPTVQYAAAAPGQQMTYMLQQPSVTAPTVVAGDPGASTVTSALPQITSYAAAPQVTYAQPGVTTYAAPPTTISYAPQVMQEPGTFQQVGAPQVQYAQPQVQYGAMPAYTMPGMEAQQQVFAQPAPSYTAAPAFTMPQVGEAQQLGVMQPPDLSAYAGVPQAQSYVMPQQQPQLFAAQPQQPMPGMQTVASMVTPCNYPM